MPGPDRGVRKLETALTAPEAAAAPFRFRRSASKVHPPRGRAIVHERLGGTRRAITGFAHPETSPVQFLSVQLFDGRSDRRRITEIDEREAAGSIGGPVDWKKDLGDRPRLSEQCFKVSLRRFVAEIPDEDS